MIKKEMETNYLCLKSNKTQQKPSCLILVEYILPSHVGINYYSSSVIYQCLHLTDCSGWRESLVIFSISKWMELTGFYWSFKEALLGSSMPLMCSELKDKKQGGSFSH